MSVGMRIDTILIGPAGGDDEPSKAERIEALVEEHGWPNVRAHLMGVLEDPARPVEHWTVAAAVFWGAALDKRPVDADRLIALVYARLPFDAGAEDNLAWSIASKLRGVGYLSDYDPLTDPKVVAELRNVRAARPRSSEEK